VQCDWLKSTEMLSFYHVYYFVILGYQELLIFFNGV